MSTDHITINRLINAPIARVWIAWTDPNYALQWFGSDPNGKGIQASMNPQPGGSFEITFQDANGTQHTAFGQYTLVEPPTRLAFTWSWKNEPGVESMVTVILFDEDEITRLQFRHEGFGDASAHQYLAGWQSTFDKLDRCLNK